MIKIRFNNYDSMTEKELKIFNQGSVYIGTMSIWLNGNHINALFNPPTDEEHFKGFNVFFEQPVKYFAGKLDPEAELHCAEKIQGQLSSFAKMSEIPLTVSAEYQSNK